MRFRQIVAAMTAASLLVLGMQTASAGVIGTAEVIAASDRAATMDRVQRALADETVRSALVAHGVDPADAAVRVASLNDQELARVAGAMDSMPAGGDSLLAIIGIVFVILLILELTGVTDIFKRA